MYHAWIVWIWIRFPDLFFLWRVLANKKLTNKCRKRDVFLLHGFEHDQWWDLCIFQLLHIFFGPLTIHVNHVWYTYPHMQLPSKFLTDPLIHQDILLTNGDLPSEDGLVKSDRRWLTPLKTEGMNMMNTWWKHTNFGEKVSSEALKINNFWWYLPGRIAMFYGYIWLRFF